MKPETAKKIMKIYGIISLAVGIIYVVFEIILLALGALIAKDEGGLSAMEFGFLGGATTFVVFAVALVTGILCLRAVKDPVNIKPAWIFILITLVLSIAAMILSFGNGIANTVTGVIPVLFNILGFVAANTIKKQ